MRIGVEQGRARQARPEDRHLRRARRRAALGRVLPRASASTTCRARRSACRSRASPPRRPRSPRPARRPTSPPAGERRVRVSVRRPAPNARRGDRRRRARRQSGFTTMDGTPRALAPIEGVASGRRLRRSRTSNGPRHAERPPATRCLPSRRGRGSPLTARRGPRRWWRSSPSSPHARACSLLGSRCGDRRVTAIWVSMGAPRLGWCWAGPHVARLGLVRAPARLGRSAVDRERVLAQDHPPGLFGVVAEQARAAPRRAPRATTSPRGSRAPACARRRRRRAASTRARARAPRAAPRPGGRRAGSSARGRATRSRRRARASRPRGRTGSSAAARSSSRGSARSPASASAGSARGRERSQSPKPQCTCTGSGAPGCARSRPARRARSGRCGGGRCDRRRSSSARRSRRRAPCADGLARSAVRADPSMRMTGRASQPATRRELVERRCRPAGSRRRGRAPRCSSPAAAARRTRRSPASSRARQHRLLGRLAAEERRQLADRPPVGHRERDVRPLPRVGALREEAAELVQRRAHAQQPVRVLVDERDAVQYFEK